MTRFTPSEHIQLLIAGYVLGDLDPGEAAEFEQLLSDNPAIAAEVAQVQTALEMAYAPPEVAPPDHLRSAILDANINRTSDRSTLQSVPNLARKRLSWSRVLGVAAAALIVGLGINNYRLWQDLQTTQAKTQQADTLAYSLQGTKVANTASARVVVNPNSLEAVLTVNNLPPLPPGKVYVLWTVLEQEAPFTVDQKKAILTEVFKVNAQGNVSQTITVPEVYRSRELVSKLAVTMEQATSPQRHKGAPVLITSL